MNPILRFGLKSLSFVLPPIGARICEYMYFRPFGPKSNSTEPAGEPFRYWLQRKELVGYVMGEGETVILLHGWRGIAADMTPIARRLAEIGFKAVSIDLPGHGGDFGSHADLFRISEAVRAVCAIHGNPVAAVAHSFGSSVVFAAFPSGGPEKVVLVAPAIRGDRYMAAFADHVGLSKWGRRVFLRRMDRYTGAHLQRIIRGEVDIPGAKFLVIHDPTDAWTPYKDSVEFVDGHSARLVTVEKAGHKRIIGHETTLAEIEGFLIG